MVGGRATIPLHLLKESSCTRILGRVFTRVTQFMSFIPGLDSYRYACFLFKRVPSLLYIHATPDIRRTEVPPVLTLSSVPPIRSHLSRRTPHRSSPDLLHRLLNTCRSLCSACYRPYAPGRDTVRLSHPSSLSPEWLLYEVGPL